MNELALFAGAGGGILGGMLLGWRTVCAVEIEPYPASVLLQRQNDGILPPFPIWDDVCTFDGNPWRGIVDVISGGFPCQDISAAGRGAGITGRRSGLWKEYARIIGEVRPRYVLVENSPMLTIRGLGTVLGDLSELGYDARWGIISAADVGAPHLRKRIWIVAYPDAWDAERRQSERPGIWESESVQGPDDNTGRSSARHVAYSDNDGTRRRKQFEEGGEISRDVADSENSGASRRFGVAGNGSGASGIGNSRGGRGKRDAWREDVADTNGDGSHSTKRNEAIEGGNGKNDGLSIGGVGWWATEPDVGRVVDELAAGLDFVKTDEGGLF